MDGDAWRRELLAGVHSVERAGWPGTIRVEGRCSEPILVGNGSSEIIMAAGEHGMGRVVVFSHDTYPEALYDGDEKYTGLMYNVKMWVTRRQWSDSTHRLVKAEDVRYFDQLAPTTVLVWYDDKSKSQTWLRDLATFVSEGGAVVVGRTPWGFLKNNPGASIEKMPQSYLLNKLQMTYMPGTVDADDVIYPDNDRARRGHCLR